MCCIYSSLKPVSLYILTFALWLTIRVLLNPRQSIAMAFSQISMYDIFYKHDQICYALEHKCLRHTLWSISLLLLNTVDLLAYIRHMLAGRGCVSNTMLPLLCSPWWRHQMETFSALLAISPVPGEIPTQRPVTRGFDVFFDLRLNKRLSKQSWGWWFETLSRPLWRHRNAISIVGLPFCFTVSRNPMWMFD